MNHRPFEDWLLADEPLNPQQRRELQNHLRVCTQCTAIAEVNLALRKARTAAPAPGFAQRWQARLAAQRRLQRRQQAIGLTILGLGGAALLTWFCAPLFLAFAASPAEWIVQWLGYLLFLTTSLEAAGEAARVLLSVLPEVTPPYFLLVFTSVLGGFSLLGTFSLWQLMHLPQKTKVSQAR